MILPSISNCANLKHVLDTFTQLNVLWMTTYIHLKHAELVYTKKSKDQNMMVNDKLVESNTNAPCKNSWGTHKIPSIIMWTFLMQSFQY